MLDPNVNELLTKVDSRYELIVATAKRARELEAGSETTYDKEQLKAVTIAAKELYAGDIEAVKPVTEKK